MEDHDVMMTTTIFLVVLVQLSVRRWNFFAQLGTGEELHNLEVKNCTICTHGVAKLWTSKAPWHPWELERRWPSPRSDTNIFLERAKSKGSKLSGTEIPSRAAYLKCVVCVKMLCDRHRRQLIRLIHMFAVSSRSYLFGLHIVDALSKRWRFQSILLF